MARHPNSNRGRTPLQFTSRICRDCRDVCPFESFCQPHAGKARGFIIRTRCHSCFRKYQREWRRAKRQNEEFRLRENAYKRNLPPTRDAEYISLFQWVRYRMERWKALGAYPCVVFMVPSKVRSPNEKPELRRRWVGKTWAFREDRVGITPPPGGIPFLRLSRQVITKHPTCPDGWDVAVRIAQNRLKLMFPKQEGE